jgi:hypothetical protein
MNAIIPANQNLPVVADLSQAFVQFDRAVSRFLATRKSDNIRATYQRVLNEYRSLAEGMGLNPW